MARLSAISGLGITTDLHLEHAKRRAEVRQEQIVQYLALLLRWVVEKQSRGSTRGEAAMPVESETRVAAVDGVGGSARSGGGDGKNKKSCFKKEIKSFIR